MQLPFCVDFRLNIKVIVMVEEAALRLPVRYARRGAAAVGAGVRTYLPIKVNTSGVMPIIFALSLVFFPSMVGKVLASLSQAKLAGFGLVLSRLFQPGRLVYIIVYFLLVVPEGK